MNRAAAATLVAVVAYLAGTTPLRAQRYSFKFYGQDEGLQNLAVQAVLQDREGFLWVGTQNGLFRYDGTGFRAFTKDDGLPGARIESLHEAADGTLWVGTGTGLARRRGDRFETVPMGAARGVVGREGIASDPQGRLYIVTDHGLLAGTSREEGMQFTPVGADAVSVYLDQSGKLWYGCGLHLCTLENGSARGRPRNGPASGTLGSDPGESGRHPVGSQCGTPLHAPSRFGSISIPAGSAQIPGHLCGARAGFVRTPAGPYRRWIGDPDARLGHRCCR